MGASRGAADTTDRAGPRAASRGAVVASAIGELLVTAGVLVLGFAAWQLWWTDLTSSRSQADTVTGLRVAFGDQGVGSAAGTPPTSAATAPPTAAPPAGQAFAVITVPRFGDDWVRPVVEGTDHEALQEGVGHQPGTVLPGTIGNFATAGHRVTYGKPYNRIDELVPGDAIVVETKAGWSVYRYVRHRVVLPSDTEVLAPVPDRPGQAPTQAWMTLIACHPPFTARERYVGYARLDRFVPRASGPPQARG